MEQIIAAIVGGLIAASTGWFFERQREKARLSKIHNLLVTGICDDLQHSRDVYDKVSSEWEKSQTIWFSSLNELMASRQTYKNNRDWITLIENAELRKRVFQYYLQSEDIISALESQQKRKYELESKFNDLVRDLMINNPELEQQQARDIAISYMQNEDREYRGLVDLIPETVLKLKEYKSQAWDLLNDLKKMQ